MAAAMAPRATALSDAELDAVRLGFEERRDAYLDSYLDEPLPEMDSALAGCREYLSEAQWIWCPGEAAAEVVSGAWSWDDEIWLRCAEEYSPVVIEVAREEDYAGDFAAFRSAVLGQEIAFEDGVLRYRGLGDSGVFTFYADSERLPEIDGGSIDLSPPYAFQSPFLQELWGAGLVRISKDDRELIVDVRD